MRTEATPVRSQAALAIFAISLVMMASKSPDALLRPQFWAEDGPIFFAQQFGTHALLITKGYAGYLHVVPRLVAWLASFFSTNKAPLVYNLMAVLIASASMTYTSLKFRPYLPLLVSLAIFLLVPVNGEIFGTITNIQWFLQFALVALCLPRDTANNHVGHDILALLLTLVLGLTGPASIFIISVNVAFLFLAWVAGRICHPNPVTQDIQAIVLRLPKERLIAVALCALVQVASLLNAPSIPAEARGIDQYGLLTLPGLALGRLVPVHVFGFEFLTPVLWMLAELAMMLAILMSRTLPLQTKVVALQLATLAISMVIGAAALKDATAMLQFILSDRYFYFAKFTVWLLAFLALQSALGIEREKLATGFVCVLIYIGIINAPNLQRHPLEDLNWRSHARELREPGIHTIPVNPVPWSFQVTTPANNTERK